MFVLKQTSPVTRMICLEEFKFLLRIVVHALHTAVCFERQVETQIQIKCLLGWNWSEPKSLLFYTDITNYQLSLMSRGDRYIVCSHWNLQWILFRVSKKVQNIRCWFTLWFQELGQDHCLTCLSSTATVHLDIVNVNLKDQQVSCVPTNISPWYQHEYVSYQSSLSSFPPCLHAPTCPRRYRNRRKNTNRTKHTALTH